MSDPKRIQRKRTKGWTMPPDAIYVGRPTKWGNPYTFTMMQARLDELAKVHRGEGLRRLGARQMAHDAFDSDLRYGPDSRWWWYGPHNGIIQINGNLAALRGHDLACWCKPTDPCHADVLLEIANQRSTP